MVHWVSLRRVTTAVPTLRNAVDGTINQQVPRGFVGKVLDPTRRWKTIIYLPRIRYSLLLPAPSVREFGSVYLCLLSSGSQDDASSTDASPASSCLCGSVLWLDTQDETPHQGEFGTPPSDKHHKKTKKNKKTWVWKLVDKLSKCTHSQSSSETASNKFMRVSRFGER